MLSAKKNNWLAAILIHRDENQSSYKWGLAKADISTGEFKIQEGNGINTLEQELLNIEASEIICEELDQDIYEGWKSKRINITKQSKTSFSLPEANAILKKHYQLKTIDGLGISEFE